MKTKEASSTIAWQSSHLLHRLSPDREFYFWISTCSTFGGTNWALTTFQSGGIGSVLGAEHLPRLATSNTQPHFSPAFLHSLLTVQRLSASFYTWGVINRRRSPMAFQTCSRFTLCVFIMLIVLTTSALAGPPLICHPIEIGNAKTLPWVELNYHKGSNGYDLTNLTKDTLAILDSNPPVLVRMETLRRATIYARQDGQAAKELLTRLHARAASSDTAHSEALAWFDVGYLTEAYKEWLGKGEPNPANGLDGYAWVKKAINLRVQDSEMEFAAALMTLAG